MVAVQEGLGYLGRLLLPASPCSLGVAVRNTREKQNSLSYLPFLGQVMHYRLVEMQGRYYEAVILKHYVLSDGSMDTL